jgi:hypothetical protein
VAYSSLGKFEVQSHELPTLLDLIPRMAIMAVGSQHRRANTNTPARDYDTN